MNTATLVQKLWNYCNILRDDGMSRDAVDEAALDLRPAHQQHYQANRASPVFEELRGLLTKTAGLAIPLQKALAPLSKKIAAAFVYGSIAKGTDRAGSDVDLLVVSENLAYAKLYAALAQAERTLARKINPNLLTPDEWRKERAAQDSFAARIGAQPKIFVVGSEDDLG